MNTLRHLMEVVTTFMLIATLGGCANLKQDGGFAVQSKSASTVRQEPWHNVTIIGDISAVDTLVVAPFNVSEPMPLKWEQELVDSARTYLSKQIDGKLVPTPLERGVERALLYDAEGKLLELFDAIFDPELMMFFVNLPIDRASALRGHMVIVSSDGTWLMTGRRKIVNLPVGQDLRQLPSGFFRENPSDLRQVILLKNPDPILLKLKWRFSESLVVNGVWYSGTRDARTILGKFTNLNTTTDRIISCGSFTISPGMLPVSLAISLLRNVYVATQEDCLAGRKEN